MKSQSKEFGGKRKNSKDILETQSIGIFEQVPWDESKIEIKDDFKELIEKENFTKQKTDSALQPKIKEELNKLNMSLKR